MKLLKVRLKRLRKSSLNTQQLFHIYYSELSHHPAEVMEQRVISEHSFKSNKIVTVMQHLVALGATVLTGKKKLSSLLETLHDFLK